MAEGILIKLIGALAGAFLALVLVPPRTLSGFYRRFAAAMIAGPIFAPQVMGYMHWIETEENIIAASCISAICSWWVLGILIKGVKALFEKWFDNPAQ